MPHSILNWRLRNLWWSVNRVPLTTSHASLVAFTINLLNIMLLHLLHEYYWAAWKDYAYNGAQRLRFVFKFECCLKYMYICACLLFICTEPIIKKSQLNECIFLFKWYLTIENGKIHADRIFMKRAFLYILSY